MHRSTVERRLHDTTERLERARAELGILDEQLSVVTEMADETRLKALVAETPLASREHAEMSHHAAVLRRSRHALVRSIDDLRLRQAELLERLVFRQSD